MLFIMVIGEEAKGKVKELLRWRMAIHMKETG